MSLELKFKAGWKLNPTKNGAFRSSTHPTKKAIALELEFKAGWKLNPTKNGAFRSSTHPTKMAIALPQERSFFFIFKQR
jgi:hypothetical protein